MTNKQIKKTVTRRLKKPLLAMTVFYLIGSTALRHMDTQGDVTVNLILMVLVLNIFFLLALMSDLIVNVLTDLNDIANKEKAKENESIT